MTSPKRPHRDQYESDFLNADAEDRMTIEEVAEPLDGARPPEAEEEDHGVFRDDGQPRPAGVFDAIFDRIRNPIVTPEDNRAPDMPEFDEDEPPTRHEADDAVTQPANDRDELGAAYSRNDPGVETKQ